MAGGQPTVESNNALEGLDGNPFQDDQPVAGGDAAMDDAGDANPFGGPAAPADAGDPFGGSDDAPADPFGGSSGEDPFGENPFGN